MGDCLNINMYLRIELVILAGPFYYIHLSIWIWSILIGFDLSYGFKLRKNLKFH